MSREIETHLSVRWWGGNCKWNACGWRFWPSCASGDDGGSSLTAVIIMLWRILCCDWALLLSVGDDTIEAGGDEFVRLSINERRRFFWAHLCASKNDGMASWWIRSFSQPRTIYLIDFVQQLAQGGTTSAFVWWSLTSYLCSSKI